MTQAKREYSWIEKAVAMVGGAVVLVLGLMFSLILLALVALVGLAAWGYFWWKTRDLRRLMRERVPPGQVIDGDAVVVDDEPANKEQALEHRSNPP